MLNTLRFKSSVLFATHTLLNKPLRVLQLSTHPSNSTANEILDCIHYNVN